MIRQQVTINVSNEGGKAKSVVQYNNISIRERILTALFGKSQKIMLFIPGDNVESVAIKEVERGEVKAI